MDDSVLPSKLLSDLSSAVDIVRRHPFIHIYSHFDADGLTAASIVAKALMREGREFSITIFPTLTDPQMEIIENTEAKCVLVTDLGASYIKRFDRMTCDVVVLDHHTALDHAERICYANPHLYEIDGGKAGCGASMALLFAVTMNEKNWDLSPLAMAGIVGDMQNKDGLKGLNVYICDEAVKRGFVTPMPGSLVPLGNLSTELFMSTSPFIEGVSGNSEGTAKFLEEAGIAPNKDYSNLTPEEHMKLSSLIAIKLINQGTYKESLEKCARPRYYLPAWGTDAASLASVVDSCGRQEEPDVGIAVCLGDSSAMERAKALNAETRKEIMTAALHIAANKDKIIELENVQWYDTTECGNSGAICSIIMDFFGNPHKPTIGVNRSNPIAKVSSRGNDELFNRKNVNLADAMRGSCAAAGGNGGGHREAAGGSFPAEKYEEFLKAVDLIIGEQMKSAGL
ncbi:MAG: DHH family phosphoesterase [archaeon]|nr:DHH family phosphoesterase [archaeon]